MKGVYIDYMGESISLPVGEHLLGREAGCMFRFTDPAVSRRHARFIHRQDEVFVEDLGSANGTLLNGRTVTAAIRLRDGDIVTVGNRELKVRVTEMFDDDESTVRIPILARAAATLRAPRMGSSTMEMAAVRPPPLTANERCPRCSAVVRAEDQKCGNCSYEWGAGPPGTKGSLNRRRQERCSADLRVAYATAMRELEATTLDISETGVFVCTPEVDPVGTGATLTLYVDNGPPLHVSGIIRRVVEPGSAHPELVGVGIELTDVGVNEREWLAFLIERLTRESVD